ncbi:MAG: hypothetical protein QMC17_03945 [Paracoccaceae bacterium]
MTAPNGHFRGAEQSLSKSSVKWIDQIQKKIKYLVNGLLVIFEDISLPMLGLNLPDAAVPIIINDQDVPEVGYDWLIITTATTGLKYQHHDNKKFLSFKVLMIY